MTTSRLQYAAVLTISCLSLSISSADEPVRIRAVNIRFIDPLANTGVAVSAKSLVTPQVENPISELRLTGPEVQKIANQIAAKSKIDRSVKILNDFAHDNIDTRVVFEFVTPDNITLRLAYGYPDAAVWINLDAPDLKNEDVTQLLSLLPYYVVMEIRDGGIIKEGNARK